MIQILCFIINRGSPRASHSFEPPKDVAAVILAVQTFVASFNFFPPKHDRQITCRRVRAIHLLVFYIGVNIDLHQRHSRLGHWS